MAPADPSPPRRRGARRRWLAALAMVVLLLPALEVLGRGYACASGAPYSAAETRADIERAVSSLTADLPTGERPVDAPREGQVFLHPFYGFEAGVNAGMAEHLRELHTTRDRTGYLEVVVLGGSVAALFASPKNGGGDELQRLLRADPRFADTTLLLRIGGRASWKQPQQLAFVTQLFAHGVEPDVVVCLDGFNEVALSSQNLGKGVHPSWPSGTQWGRVTVGLGDERAVELVGRTRALQDEVRAVADHALSRGYPRSMWLGRSTLRRLGALSAELAALREAFQAGMQGEEPSALPRTGPAFEGDLEEAMARSVEQWAACSRMVRDLCEARGIPYLHVLQPTLLDAGSKPLTDNERARGGAPPEWRDGVRIGYPLLREAGAALAAEGEAFLDGSRVFAEVEEDLYYDSCHFHKAGNEHIARFLWPRLRELLPE